MTTMQENLTKAQQEASFLVGSLRDALKTSGAVEGLVVLQLIKKAAEMRNEIDNFISAVEACNG